MQVHFFQRLPDRLVLRSEQPAISQQHLYRGWRSLRISFVLAILFGLPLEGNPKGQKDAKYLGQGGVEDTNPKTLTFRKCPFPDPNRLPDSCSILQSYATPRLTLWSKGIEHTRRSLKETCLPAVRFRVRGYQNQHCSRHPGIISNKTRRAGR